MPRKPSISLEQKIEIHHMTRSMTVPEIAEALNMPVKKIRSALAGFPSLKPKHVITPELIKKVMELLPEHTNGEIAEILQISTSSVRRVIEQYELRRTREQDAAIRSRIRSRLLTAERRRVLFGLDQQTRLKVFSNQEKNILRGLLRRLNYHVIRNDMTILYDKNTSRNETYEMRGVKLGLSFAPYPVI